MIVSFSHKGLEKFFKTGSTAGIQVKHKDRLSRILFALENAKTAQDMNVASYNFHSLKGDKKELYSVKVNGNWRITFTFIDGNAYVVDYQDYH